MIDQLKAQIKVVAEARQNAHLASDAKTAARIEWENRNKPLFEIVTETALAASEAEARLRELTLQAYAETGMKVPTPGVGIREVTKLEYDPQDAFAWAIQHTIALKLDVIAFVKLAKVSPRTSTLTIIVHPTHT